MRAPGALWELVVKGGPTAGHTVPVSDVLTLGSAEASSVRLSAAGVQPAHAEIKVEADGLLWVKNLAGPNDTLVDGAAVTHAVLTDGATLRLGQQELAVRQRVVSSRGPISKPVPALTASGVHVTSVHPGLGDQGGARSSEGERPASSSAEPSVLVNALVMKGLLLEPGQVVAGRYEIVDQLAEGGMGEVYKARHVELGKTFALKVMKQELSNDREFVDRFKREAVAASRIGQHNIVDISDFGRTEEGRFYFVMEYLEGQTLAELLKAERVLPVERALLISLQIARALAAAHAQGIVHRDLKPENVVVQQRQGTGDFIKVLDFGIAKVADGRGQGGQTGIGVVVGTPQYMSPEQAAAIPIDARSDIYSLGLIVYELVTGRTVFQGATPSLIMAAHINQAPLPMSSGPNPPALPADFEPLVSRMLAKSTDDRPQTMNEVVQAFELILREQYGVAANRATPVRTAGLVPALPAKPSTGEQPPVAAARASTGEVPKPVSRTPLWAGAAAALALAGLGLWPLLREAPPKAPSDFVPAPPVVVRTPPPDDVPALAVVQPARVSTVRLTLRTTPARAEVFEGDALIGKTPLTLDWENGRAARLSFKLDGFVPEERTVAPRADLDVELELKAISKKGPRKKPGKYEDDLKDAPY